MGKSGIYFPGLNGLRAIAAFGVVIFHVTMQLDKFNLHYHIFGSDPNGDAKVYLLATYGVTIFFVLSGFLITYLLLTEKERQPVSIKNFYIRRILRIWPLYYSYFFICLVFILIYNMGFNWLSAILYLLMSANIATLLLKTLPLLEHYWSIGVEEQFYLFWPWLVKKLGKNLIAVIFSLTVIQLVFRVIVWYLWPYSFVAETSMLLRFDCMMIGALGAIFYKQNHVLFLRLADNKITQFICLSVLALLICNKFHTNAIVDTFLISIVSLGLIIGQINVENRIVNFDNRVMDFLGKISYGIYIYHMLIIFLAHKFIFSFHNESAINYILVYGAVIGLTILVSYISFVYFEKRFIGLKGKYTSVESSNSRT